MVFPRIIVLLVPFILALPEGAIAGTSPATAIIVKLGTAGNRISAEWKQALTSRMSDQQLDSLSRLKRALSEDEQAWERLIRSKALRWNASRDSLQKIFGDPGIPDTVFVLLGYMGLDDGFTFGYNTVCLDLTALQM